jgi:phosphopantetheine--protein transferase-like protein
MLKATKFIVVWLAWAVVKVIEEKATAYLARLSGTPVASDQTVKLNSVQGTAFLAWLRKEGVQIDSIELSGAPFTVENLFNSRKRNSIPDAPKESSVPVLAPRSFGSAVLGIGIDIEDAKSLPEASDYRTHEFYKDNFSPAEIAYCILQPSTRMSLTGLWVAKEAIVKSGTVPPSEGLKKVEILHDDAGRPSFPSCVLSISHMEQVAVAVAIWRCPLATPLQADDSQLMRTTMEVAGLKRYPRQKTISVGLAIVTLLAVAIYWIFETTR